MTLKRVRDIIRTYGYVANMYTNAVRLCLEDPKERREDEKKIGISWREDKNSEWEEKYFPVNLGDVLTNYQNLEIDDDDLESTDYEDFSESSDSEL